MGRYYHWERRQPTEIQVSTVARDLTPQECGRGHVGGRRKVYLVARTLGGSIAERQDQKRIATVAPG